METVKVKFLNNSKAYIECPEDIRREMMEAYTFYVENHKFHPLVKARRWDGKKRLFNARQSTLPVGLVPNLSSFVAERGYNLELSKEIANCFFDESFTKEYFAEFVTNLIITDDGQRIFPYDYQLRMAHNALKYKRQVFLSATATGKSLGLYLMIRLMQEQFTDKILLIVPNVGLVEQMYSDFDNYSQQDDDWVASENCERLHAEYSYRGNKQVLISTWQSLLPIIKTKNPENIDFFKQFKAVMVDEVHGAKGQSIQSILEECVNAEYRVGLTGTLDGSEVNELVIKGSLGPVVKIQTVKQATDAGRISPLKIECIELQYKNVDLPPGKMDYQTETSFLNGCEERNRFILNLVKNIEGNTLVLFSRIETHGDVLYDMFQKELGNRKLFYIHGGVDGTERNEIRAIVEKESNAVILASYGTTSTGVSIKNIRNIVFASPSKSVVRVLQSIGRGLRKLMGKELCTLYDIYDNFLKANENFSLAHAGVRFGIYAEQEMKMKIRKIEI